MEDRERQNENIEKDFDTSSNYVLYNFILHFAMT